ncbi:hypothetical protein ACIRBX_29220 [Kitasatospora sp. NPDC096147]|uniref:hypothetical protein n=1 Tax=Kitasatospora sp. NPDC096147 TaxID=3364093 RepID=UPI0038185FB9
MGWCLRCCGRSAAPSRVARAQLRRYRPQAAAHSIAASELALIEAKLSQLSRDSADTDEILARLDRDAEDAISREHTIWQARREVHTTDLLGM